MLPYVFVSHASQDKSTLRHVVDALIERDLKMWVDNPSAMGYSAAETERHFYRLHADKKWQDEIDEALTKASAVLVCFSRHFCQGTRHMWHDEVAGARQMKKLVACRIDDVDPSMLPNNYATLQIPDVRVDLPEEARKAALALLIDDVSRKLSDHANQVPPSPWKAFDNKLAVGAPFQAPPLPPHFVPRPEAYEGIKSRLIQADPTSAGVLVISAIHGLGGIGKTVLAAALARDPDVQSRYPDGVLWTTLGQTPDLLSVLTGWVREGLGDHEYRPTSLQSAQSHLRSLLHGKAMLIVVDDVWKPEHAESFQIGGSRCQIIITTRRIDVADEVGAALYQLDSMTPQQSIALFAARLGRPLEQGEEEQALLLADALGGLPLALELAATRIARGVSWVSLREALDQEVARLEALESPRDRRKDQTRLEASLTLSVNALRDEDEGLWEAFVWLGVLPEDTTVSAPMLATLWETSLLKAADTLDLFWNDALLLPSIPMSIGDKAWPGYRLHDLVHDLCIRLLVRDAPAGMGLAIESAHEALLQRYKRQLENRKGWSSLPHDGYVHAHLTWHMQKAGQHEQIHALLLEENERGQAGWYESRERLGQTAGYLADVAKAWQLADGDRSLHMAVRYALIMASLNSLADAVPPALIVAAVKRNIWSATQALAYARQISNSKKRRRILSEIAPNLDEALQWEALGIAGEIAEKSERAKALVHIGMHLDEPHRGRVEQEGLAAVRQVRDRYARAKLLIDLSESYLPERAAELLREALSEVRDIPQDWPRNQTKERIAIALAKLGDVEAAQEVARSVESAFMSADFSRRFAKSLDDKLRVPAAQGPVNNWSKALEVSTSAQAGSDADVRATIEGVRSLHEAWPRAKALVELSAHVSAEERTSLIEEALLESRTISDKFLRAELLASVADGLPTSTLRSIIDDVREISDTESRDALLSMLILFGALEGDIHRALNDARRLQALSARAITLIGLSARLPEAERAEIAREVLRISRAVDGGSDDDSIAESTAMAFARVGSADDALHAAALIQNPWWRDELLKNVVAILSSEQGESPAPLARKQSSRVHAKSGSDGLDAAGRSASLKAETDDWTKARLVSDLVKSTPSVPLQHAMEVVEGIQDDWAKSEALKALRETLPPDLFGKFIGIARSIGEEGALADVIADAAGSLPKSLLPEVFDMAQFISRRGDRARALRALTPYLCRLPSECVLSLLRQALRTTARRKRSEAFSDIGSLVPMLVSSEGIGVVGKTYEAVRVLCRWWP